MLWSAATVALLLVATTWGQKSCKKDGDCGEDAPCCSSYGYCGSGKGFCTEGTKSGPGENSPQRSGSGCSLENVEFVGGDLSPLEGGGGIQLQKNNDKECYNKCEENFRCKYFTYDEREELCYLKYARGYARNRTDGFFSGSTDRNGCEKEASCEPPYYLQREQCLYYCEEDGQGGISIADVRRNYNHSKEFCEKYGGFLPYEFLGSQSAVYADRWHWVGHPGPDRDSCYAARPRYWPAEGLRAFSCSAELNYACEKNRRYALPAVEPPQRYYSAAEPAVLVAAGDIDPVPGLTGRRALQRLRPRLLTPLQRRHLLLRRYLANSYLYL